MWLSAVLGSTTMDTQSLSAALHHDLKHCLRKSVFLEAGRMELAARPDLVKTHFQGALEGLENYV